MKAYLLNFWNWFIPAKSSLLPSNQQHKIEENKYSVVSYAWCDIMCIASPDHKQNSVELRSQPANLNVRGMPFKVFL